MPRRPSSIRTTAATASLLVALVSPLAAFAAPPLETFVPAGAADGDLFGVAVDVDAPRVAVGAPSTDLERDDVGVVYLLELDAGSGDVSEVAMLASGDGELGDSFGSSVAISGDAVLVGAPGVVLGELNEGAAYVFERSGGDWNEVARLRRDTTARNDMFGAAVALDGDVAVVGAPGADDAGIDAGAATIYERVAGAWERVATLVPDGEAGAERFGAAVAVDGDRILIGASAEPFAGEHAGSAYLFVRSGGDWKRTARWTPSGGKGGDGFGDAVALEGDLALVGARFADLHGSDEGAAYVFARTGDGWREVVKLTLPKASDRDAFGQAVALAGGLALVGAPRVDAPHRDSGGVWGFVRGEEGWTLSSRFSPSASGAYDEFGTAVAADASLVVVGAPQDIPAAASEDVVTGTVTPFEREP